MARSRSSDQIREDALAVGSKKLEDGCVGCAEGYFELARRHGATDGDIQKARSFSRLDALKAGAASLVGFVAVGSLMPSLAAASSAPKTMRYNSGTIVNGDATLPIVRAALNSHEVKALRTRLEQRGYTLSLDHSRGYDETSTGRRIFFLLFASPNDPHTFAQIIWGSDGTGQEHVSAEIWQRNPAATIPANYQSMSRADAQQWLDANVKVTPVTTNEVVTPLPGSEGATAHLDALNSSVVATHAADFNSCVLSCTVAGCGPAAITCILTDIAYLFCLGVSCGAVFYSCNASCLFA